MFFSATLRRCFDSGSKMGTRCFSLMEEGGLGSSDICGKHIMGMDWRREYIYSGKGDGRHANCANESHEERAQVQVIIYPATLSIIDGGWCC